MIIDIDDATREHRIMEADEEILEIAPWIVLNLNEIASTISFLPSIGEEENVTQDIIDDEINEYFSFIHEYIFEEIVNKLEQNGVKVL